MNRQLRERIRANAADGGVALLAAIGAIAGSLLAIGDQPGFVGASAAAVVRDTLPDLFIAIGIGTLRDLAQPLLALSSGLLLLVVYASLVFAVGRALDSTRKRALATFLLVGALTALLTGNLTSTAGASVVAAAVVAAANATLNASPTTTVEPPPGRRRVLQAGAVAVASLLLGVVRGREPAGAGLTEPQDSAAASLLAVADERSFSLPNADGLVSDGFYTVDIATVDPRLNPGDWQLAVTGQVETERSFTLEELKEFPAERRFVTLRCVSDLLNGEKVDTALWDGVPVSELLDEVGAPESCCVTLHGADDYYVSFPREALDPGLLAWGMNGRSLPRAHGAPLRTLVPGHWGETNAKWLTEIEIRDEPEDGYWEERGWEGTGEVHTVAKLHSTTVDGGTVRVGGHAYAGTRGIERVEVSTDGGDSWTEASLSETLPGPVSLDETEPEPTGEAADAWQMWEHEYEKTGEHEVVVRAVDGNGDLQTEDEQDGYPSGPTGWVRKTVQA